ncbi:MAG: DUF4276 family protein [Myxococcaceae bacterium]|nr:DUF4276 family protein [Myxococcaceae bacterium]
MTVKLFVEGGGDNNKSLKTKCREAFSRLIERALPGSRKPRIVACGGRNAAYEDYRNSQKVSPSEIAFLLIDSESPVPLGETPVQYLRRTMNWEVDDHAHLMVQCMESWLLADRDCLSAYFGQGFNLGALPARADVELVPKQDVFSGLAAATRHSRTKGEYAKASHSFALLGEVDPHRLLTASPRAAAFFADLARL